jgi:hypothetical protein
MNEVSPVFGDWKKAGTPRRMFQKKVGTKRVIFQKKIG